jgi:hypothetical protein
MLCSSSLLLHLTLAADAKHLTQTTEGGPCAALPEIKHLPPSDASSCLMVCCAFAAPSPRVSFTYVSFLYVWRLMLNISLKPLKASLVLRLVK